MIDKTKLKQDIEVMKEKLASMEKELNKPDDVKHFPSLGDVYYVMCSNGATLELYSSNDKFLVNTYKTREEAQKAYDKAVAIEKIKRRLLELQGDWIPDWTDRYELKTNICYYHFKKVFEVEAGYFTQNFNAIPYMKSEEIAQTIIDEMKDELRLILNIA